MNWGRAFRDELNKRAAYVAASNTSRLRIGGGARNVGVATPPVPSSGSPAGAQARAVRSAVNYKPPLRPIIAPPVSTR